MRQALSAAARAYRAGDVPVGAVLICGDRTFIAGNRKEQDGDPTAHAEMVVIREAALHLRGWRLGGTLYTTLEPCAMCAGAVVHARIDRLVFAAVDPKAGACGSVLDAVRAPGGNHKLEVASGVLANRSSRLLRRFFRLRRGVIL